MSSIIIDKVSNVGSDQTKHSIRSANERKRRKEGKTMIYIETGNVLQNWKGAFVGDTIKRGSPKLPLPSLQQSLPRVILEKPSL